MITVGPPPLRRSSSRRSSPDTCGMRTSHTMQSISRVSSSARAARADDTDVTSNPSRARKTWSMCRRLSSSSTTRMRRRLWLGCTAGILRAGSYHRVDFPRPMRVTANQVTFTRLVAMPFLAVLLYGGTTERLLALILGFLVGFTDYVDGYLARKQGPTVLGGLMDPIADKVFLALVILPFGQLGLMPWWAVAAVLLREFLVTALRSSFELRKRTLKTTYFAKVKTWVQMLSVF